MQIGRDDVAMKNTKLMKFWLREPRKGWRNDGGPIPYGLRSHARRRDGSKTVIIACPFQRVRVGHWIVLAGNQAFQFSPADMKRLYSRVPL